MNYTHEGPYVVHHVAPTKHSHNSLILLGVSYFLLAGFWVAYQQILSRGAINSVSAASSVVSDILVRPSNIPPDTRSLLAEARAKLKKADQQDAKTSQRLQKIVDQWVGKNTSLAVSLRGIGNKVSADINSSAILPIASIYKLFAVRALDETVPSSSWDTTRLPGGKTLRDCVYAMISVSDNSCALAIVTKLGGWNYLESRTQGAGYLHTHFYGGAYTAGTTQDTTRLMQRIYNGTAMSDTARDLAISAMKSQFYKEGIPAGCPDCKSMNKTGNTAGVHNDTAIITLGGEQYVLTIFTNGKPWSSIAALTAKLAVVLK